MNATEALDHLGNHIRWSEYDATTIAAFQQTIEAFRTIREERAELLEVLKEIARGEGAFSRDPLEHAENCIEHAKAIAKAVIAKTELTEASGADP